MKLNLADRIRITYQVSEGSRLEKILSAETTTPSFLSSETLSTNWQNGVVPTTAEVFEGAGELAFEVTKVAG